MSGNVPNTRPSLRLVQRGKNIQWRTKKVNQRDFGEWMLFANTEETKRTFGQPEVMILSDHIVAMFKFCGISDASFKIKGTAYEFRLEDT